MDYSVYEVAVFRLSRVLVRPNYVKAGLDELLLLDELLACVKDVDLFDFPFYVGCLFTNIENCNAIFNCNLEHVFVYCWFFYAKIDLFLIIE